ncbi:MAG: cupin domain-containing protein [Acidobacteriota bacterium]
MELFQDRHVDYQPADPASFTGSVKAGLVLDGNPDSRVYRVEFGPGGRTHWHSHEGMQLLMVEKGRGWVQTEGETPIRIGPGDVVRVDPGEKHWHGASEEHEMIHWAVNRGIRTEWLEEVSDQEYASLDHP